MRELTIGKNDAGQRLDKFLSKALDLPQALLYKSVRLKKIKVNRKRAEIGQKLCEGDTVQCFLKDEFFRDETDSAIDYKNITAELDVVYEDENVLLINKRPGLSVHEDEHSKNQNLITEIIAYLYNKGEYDPKNEQSFTPALCNRIDRNTGGIVIAAKTAEALRVMNEKIKSRELDKFYLAAVHGVPEKKEDTLRAFLLKDEKTNSVKIFKKNPPRGAKSIITKYRVIAKNENNSLLEVELLTGRTHQIRAHLASEGYPLLGDGKYGINKADRELGFKYQALYSYRLRFNFDTEKEQTALDYLNGREFKIKRDEIYFTKLFFK